MGVIEVGMCKTVAIFRAMNGYTEARIGGTGRQAPVFGAGAIAQGIHGMNSAGQSFAPTFMRHMYEYGHYERTVGAREGGTQQARLQQSTGLLQGPGHRR